MVEIVCYVAKICEPLNSQPIDFAVKQYPHLSNLPLADSNPRGLPLDIDVLIGSDYYWAIFDGRVIKGTKGPTAMSSKLGYILNGPVNNENNRDLAKW